MKINCIIISLKITVEIQSYQTSIFIPVCFSDDELGFNVLKDFTQMTDYEGMLGSGGGVNRNYALRNISI